MQNSIDNDMNRETGNFTPALSSNLQILETEEDRMGNDILSMSDFLGRYTEELENYIRSCERGNTIVDIPVADAVIVGEALNQAKAVTKGMVQYIPDFEHLPKDIKEKFAQGIYKIGESRQVEGNVRAVLVDQEGVRVKDITLKEIRADAGTLEASRNIANQVQMKQISSQLNEIEAMQSYQIERDRDRDIYVPFFEARRLVLNAQLECEDEERRKSYLRDASSCLSSALTSTYRDIETSGKHLVDLTSKRFWRSRKSINELIGFTTTDLQILPKMVGMNVRALAYLGDKTAIKIEVDRYQRCTQDFFTKILPGCECTLVELIHENYPYKKDNMNSWYTLAFNAKESLKELEQKGMEHIYLISAEDPEDGEK